MSIVPQKPGKVQLYGDTRYLYPTSDVVIDLSQSQYFFIEIDRNVNLHISNPKDGCMYRIGIKQNSTGGYTPTLYFTNHLGIHSSVDSTVVKWKDQQTGIFSISGNVMDRLDIWYVNGTFYPQLADNF